MIFYRRDIIIKIYYNLKESDMKFKIDHDMHIHSNLSPCANDPKQTPETILAGAKRLGYKTICLTDHFWDTAVSTEKGICWGQKNGLDHISKYLPLPEDDEVLFLFGCEADMDGDDVIGISKEIYDEFDFIIIPTTHFHLQRGERWATRDPKIRARYWVERFDALLNSDLPFRKVGLAHMTCCLMDNSSPTAFLNILDEIPTDEMVRLFTKAAEVGMGIELNYCDCTRFPVEDTERVLRIYRTAKECGCKFYLGSDSHESCDYETDLNSGYERMIELLGLTEEDKFPLPKKAIKR